MRQVVVKEGGVSGVSPTDSQGFSKKTNAKRLVTVSAAGFQPSPPPPLSLSLDSDKDGGKECISRRCLLGALADRWLRGSFFATRREPTVGKVSVGRT